jgi:MEDS: MEthanogen/methylotroph, DcmR Sensory domain/Histidine kinase-like ATPase domain
MWWWGTVVGGTGNLNAGHVVQFYAHEEELSDRVAGYLLGALNRDGVAIVIATQAHRQAFEARLTDAGADLAEAVRSGAYLALEARQTADAFVRDGRLDRDGFERMIGGLIGQADRGGSGAGPVRAYGEMVSVLWDAGLVSAAVELEQLWDDLAGRHSFSLLCGYPADSVMRSGHLDAFAEVCRLHREVVGSWPPHAAKRTFAFSTEAPAAARHFAVGTLRRLGAAEQADDVALVVTELAANAVVHAHSAFTVDLAVRPDLLRISVRDDSPLPAAAADPALPAAPLHGLGAVAALASRWGVEPLGPDGKAVWAELRRAP